MSKRYRAKKAYACWDCDKVYLDADAARSCCAPSACKRCGGPTDQKFYTACAPCREVLKLERAKVVKYEDCSEAPVYSEDAGGDWGDGYSSEICGLEQWCAENDVAVPAYVHPCEADPFSFDPANILDHVHDNHHEDAVDQVVGFDELSAFFKQWNAKQNLVSYHPDKRKVIILDQSRYAGIFEAAPPHQTATQ